MNDFPNTDSNEKIVKFRNEFSPEEHILKEIQRIILVFKNRLFRQPPNKFVIFKMRIQTEETFSSNSCVHYEFSTLVCDEEIGSTTD